LIGASQYAVPNGKVGIELNRFPGFFNRLWVVTRRMANQPCHESMGIRLARIRLDPRFQSVSRLNLVSCHLKVIGCFDKESLRRAGTAAQLVSPPSVLHGEGRLFMIAVPTPQVGIGHREVRVELDSSL